MLAGAVLITLFVLALVAMGFGGPRAVRERRWSLGLGVWFALAVLGATLAAALAVGERLQPRGEAALEVRAHARQWGWSFSLPEPGGGWVETGDVLHIPAGRPVDVIVTAEDVIHSFWVPRLGGKIDAIPGRANRLRIEAAAPGVHEGLCAEFCGIGHGAMRFGVVVQAADDWDADREAGRIPGAGRPDAAETPGAGGQP